MAFKLTNEQIDEMFKPKEKIISLTSKNSHKITIYPGVGSFIIGTKGVSKGNFDALVEENDIINWDAFNYLYIPASINKKKELPYGDWPRFFSYHGNDLGFIKWSKKRAIEDFYWYPEKNIVADFTDANINFLKIYVNTNIDLTFGKNVHHLELIGNISKLKIKKCLDIPTLSFCPRIDKTKSAYKLPTFKALKNAKEINIRVNANSIPFDCSSLLQFPNLKNIYLVGNMKNLDVLKRFKNLEKIGLWEIKDLSNFPDLENWKNLKSLIAVNINEDGGKKLRSQLRKLQKEEKITEYSTVCKLRNIKWFLTYSGLPFNNLDGPIEKKAIKIYQKCAKDIADAKTKDEIKIAIVNYTKKFNKLEFDESFISDDVYIALSQIMENSPIKIQHDEWFKWFDENR